MIGRGSGVLNHISSLPSPFAIGDLGPWAYRFARFLRQAKQRYWQILPITAVSAREGYSPYSGPSAYAGNILFISPQLLVEAGRISSHDLTALPPLAAKTAEFAVAGTLRERLILKAYDNFTRHGHRGHYEDFCAAHARWLDEFALFSVLKRVFHREPWHRWPREIRDRHPETLLSLRQEYRVNVEHVKFAQFLFFEQWRKLREHCRRENIYFIGDVPFYVSHDSADVWAHPEFFHLDAQRKPAVVSGVAPEMFNRYGQKWGHPIFRWETLKQNNYDWWVQRLRHNLVLYDFIRLDHFQGFFSYWEIPAGAKTALHGREASGPGPDLILTLSKSLPLSTLIAEDLGNITAATREAIIRYQLPGMKPLLFAFDESLPLNPYAPHNVERNSVVYTGTHDCNTVRGWFEKDTTPEMRRRLFAYLGKSLTAATAPWEMIRMAMLTVADSAIVPIQDLLGLGSEGRMNVPGATQGNWRWRFREHDITPQITRHLAALTILSGRA